MNIELIFLLATALGMAPAASAAAKSSERLAVSFPYQTEGKVVYVDDGDTLVLLDSERRQLRIRLTDLDAPETPKKDFGRLGQPYSKASGANLSALAKGKQASAYCYEYDGNDRLVCRVVVNGVDVSLEQIRSGYAWANGASRRYVRDGRAYQLEREASAAKIGLWRDPAPIEPWIWRKSCWIKRQCNGAGE
jgi:endonuclease YncB( thermonuclease family)